MEKLYPYRGPACIKGKLHLWISKQGYVEAKPIKEFQSGEIILWKNGMLSEVIPVTPKGSTFVILLHREDDEKLYERTLQKETLLAMVPQQGARR